MPFLPALSGYWQAPSGPTARIHVAVCGRRNDRRRVSFHLSRELIEKAGWQAGERFVIALGTGTDIGAFQISRCTKPRAGLKLIPQHNARGFRLHITLPPEIHGLRPADFLDDLASPLLDYAVEGEAMVLRSMLRAAEEEPAPSNIRTLQR